MNKPPSIRPRLLPWTLHTGGVAVSNEGQEHEAGWYPNPEGEGQRFWDGDQWTDQYRPAAGWYPNPEGEGERYWNGGEWTDNFRQPKTQESPWWRVPAALVGAVIVIGALIALGDSSEPGAGSGASGGDAAQEQEAPAVSCGSAPADLVAAIAEGLDVQGDGNLAGGASVSVPSDLRNDRGWPERFVAARIVGPGMGDDTVGVWATGQNGGPIIAVNQMAQAFSTWGEAAQPGSPMDEVRTELARSDEADGAEACVETG